MISIDTDFDSGAIEVLSLADPAAIRLAIRKDNAAEFAQWFHFRLAGARGVPLTIHFENAGACAYPGGWRDYRVVASHDRRDWFRLPASFDGERMTMSLTPEHDFVWLAYFEPYPHERHLELIGRANASPHVRVESLGRSVDGRDMTLLRVTEGGAEPAGGLPVVWLIARQHPGESMAEWFAEGFLERLLDDDDPLARGLRERCVLYVVPNMNPDGAARGNLRTNAAGANLNREWAAPSPQRSPEVWLVRRRMEETGVDLFLDAHGDEELPWNFLAGSEGVAGYGPRVAALEAAFKAAWAQASPDFQDRHGYPKCAPGAANPTLATNWVAGRFGCLAFTIEMPFKDNADRPDPRTGWNGARSRAFGASVLDPVAAVLADMRER